MTERQQGAQCFSDPALEALWKNVLDRWNEDKAHDAFLEHCRQHDQLVEAAVRYRGMSGDHERAPVAEKRLKAVAVLAMARLESSRSTPPPARRQLGAMMLIALFVLLTIGLLFFYSSR